MKLTSDIKNSLSSYMKNLEDDIKIVLQKGNHAKRKDMVTFLADVCDVSNKLYFEESNLKDNTKSPITFALFKNEIDSGIRFTGIPGGHEFNSFVLAILQLGGSDLKLDPGIMSMVGEIKEKLKFEIFISLDCHICPDVVQALNKFAILNDKISCEMIDGGLFKEDVEERNIQGVPTIFLNNEFFSSGRTDTSKIINKLKKIELTDENINNISLELQDSIVETLISKSLKASQDHGINNIVVTGGVSANKRLRDKFSQVSNYDVFFPDVKFSTDNGAMIAYAGFLKSRSSDIKKDFKIKPNPSLTL